MTGEVLAAARLLFQAGQVVEVRAITGSGVASGYFDSLELLAQRAETLDKDFDVLGVYVTLNQVDPGLIARRANRVKMRLGRKDATTADGDIVRRQWFPVDIDPVRPSGVSSTDEEHGTAIRRARMVAGFLEKECGWPGPVLADSGNGAHLLYRIDLPNDDASRDLVRRCLEVLAARFDDGKATVDTANFNAARIWKLYGTVSRKGDDTRQRPHRRAAVLESPAHPSLVTTDMLGRLMATAPQAPPGKTDSPVISGKGSRTALDLRSWLAGHGIEWTSEKPYRGGTLFLLRECPFSGDHHDGAYAIQFPSGAVHVACHHQSCGGGAQRWHELRRRYEPGVVPGKKLPGTPEKPPVQGTPVPCTPTRDDGDGKGPESPFPPGPGDDPAIAAEALAVLEGGDPKQYLLDTFASSHEGDRAVAECLVLSLASRFVTNTNGLHVSITGESGKGKSHAFATMLRQVPERFRLEGAMSNKALFYMEGLQPGSVIILDDRVLSEDMAGILKGVITSFRKPFIYRTVNKDRHGQVCTIPERCVWWVAKVEGAGDDQVFNRMLTCWIDDSPEQDDRVLERVLKKDLAPPSDESEENHAVLVCRAVWDLLARRQFFVVIPFSTRIRFQAHANRRNPEMLLDLIKANALLNMMQRERYDQGRYHCLTATQEDFDEAARLYALLNGPAGGQTTKLTRRESEVLGLIAGQTWEEFTVPMLQKVTGATNGSLHRVLHGYSSHGTVFSGLLEKCPAISFTDRTVLSEDPDTRALTRRRTNAYTFDREVYDRWDSGTAVWIDHGPGPGGDGSGDGTAGDPASSIPPGEKPCPQAENGGQETASTGPDPQNTGTENHLDERDPLSSGKSQITEQGVSQAPCTSSCVYDPGTTGGQDTKTDGQSLMADPTTETSPNTLHQPGLPTSGHLAESILNARGEPRSGNQGTGAGNGLLHAPSVHDGGQPGGVHALDYKLLDPPGPGAPCFLCGRRATSFIEKLTKERLSRPENMREARRLCRTCYEAAVRRDRASAPPLPGVVDLAALVRVTRPAGKCSVCHLGPAAWRDPGADLDLCEACYSREAQGRAGAGDGTGIPGRNT